MLDKVYINIAWPEYSKLREVEGYKKHSYYCASNNNVFVERDWYIENCIPHKDYHEKYNEGDIIKFKDGTIAKATKAIYGCNYCTFINKSALFCDDIHCNNGNGSFIFKCLKKGEHYYDEY